MLESQLERAVANGRSQVRIAELERELATPPFPFALHFIWSTYFRLRRRKASNGFGPAPIEWPDIVAFTAMAKFPLTPWEISLIEDIDDLFLAEQALQASQQKGEDGSQNGK